MNKFYLILILSLFSVFAQAQIFESDATISYNLSKADKLFDEFYYKEAVKIYKRSYKEIRQDSIVALKIARSYFKLNMMQDAANWFQKTSPTEDQDILWFAQSLGGSGRYNDATEQYNNYLKKHPSDKRAKHQVNMMAKLLLKKDENIDYVIKPFLGNSDGSDFSPAYFGDYIVFASSRTRFSLLTYIFQWDNSRYLDLYYAPKNINNEGVKVKQLKGINSKFHEGPLVFHHGDSKVLFSRNSFLNGTEKLSEEGINKINIYEADIIDGKVEKSSIHGFQFNNKNYSVGHPTMYQDSVLYFTSDKPGGFGGMDLYKSIYIEESASWSEPQNLGEQINTEGNEVFPFITEENKLYFSSNGHGGQGGLDLFIFDKNKVENIGSPMNSTYDDFGLIIEGSKSIKTGYFSSNRPSVNEHDNIYQFIFTTEPFKIIGKVKVGNTEEELFNALVTLIDKNGKSVTIETDKNGKYSFEVDRGKTYQVKCEKKGYFTIQNEVNTAVSDTTIAVVEDVNLFKMDIGVDLGKILGINPIYFDLNKSEIRADAAQELDKIIKSMRENPSLVIELGSHTDARGSDDYNTKLSDLRAKSSAKYIQERIDDATRIFGKGYGESLLVNKCKNGVQCSELEHQLNRRTEFKVIKF